MIKLATTFGTAVVFYCICKYQLDIPHNTSYALSILSYFIFKLDWEKIDE